MSSRILKAANVFIDQDNTVHIKSEVITMPLPETVGVTEIDPEEVAENVVKKAETDAELILRRADMDSKDIISKAQDEAEKIIADAEARMEKEAKKIREETYQDAYKQGKDKAEAEGSAIRAEAQSVLDAAIQERDETRRAIEPDAVNLVIKIVEKLIGNAIEVNPAVVVSLIRMGFAGATLSGKITVRVSEADYPHVADRMDELMAAAGGTVELEIVKDMSLNQTDCIIDTPFGGIDVSLQPQYEALRENLIFLLEHP